MDYGVFFIQALVSYPELIYPIGFYAVVDFLKLIPKIKLLKIICLTNTFIECL